jgi:phage regulator Rha-like protein
MVSPEIPNDDRLHSPLGYVAPKVKLEGREKQIFKERDNKLEAARDARKQKRRQEKQQPAQHRSAPEKEPFIQLTQQG